MIGEKTAATFMASFFLLPILMLAMLTLGGISKEAVNVCFWLFEIDAVVCIVACASICVQVLKGS